MTTTFRRIFGEVTTSLRRVNHWWSSDDWDDKHWWKSDDDWNDDHDHDNHWHH